MRRIYILSILFLATSFGWEANAQNGGNTCAEAVTAGPGIYSDAAIVPGTGGATETGATDALWYSYTAEGDGTIGINSCASDPAGIDTRLYVYTDGCDTLTPVANDDDACDAPNNFGSLVADVAVVSGQEYLIQWDDRWGADAFDWELTFTPNLDPTELPITLENQLPGFGDFNGSFTQAIANPDVSGANTSATVAENTVPANAAFAGVNFGLDTNIDITTQKGFNLTVWSPVANIPVLLKLENGSGANAEVAATTTTTGAWETISFDFSAVGQLTYESVTLFMNFNQTDPATQVYYWDNLEQVDVVITGGAQIVEIDADQTGTDDQEFVEIKTEFANQSLNGMIAVFYNGSSDTSYRTVDLTGFASDDNGYFLLGSDAVAGADITMGADNTIQNGADAVALHTADAANFPDGTPVTTDGLVDAVVYGTSDADDTGLLTGLGQTTQWDENENGAKDTESLQFDAATGTFCAQVPTPKAANILCGPPAPLVELPITLEDGQLPGFGDFNGSFTQAIANPDATGENTSATVAENTVPANAGFAGVNFALDTNIDITTDKFFTMAVWSQVPNMPVLLKLENASGANAEVAVNTTTTGAWETITFDFSAIGQLTYESVTLFMNFAVTDPATQVYYWDNLAQTGEPVGDDGINCAVAIPVTPGVYNDAAITVGSGGAAQDDAADALWYVYTAEADGTININSCFSVPEGIDTRLNVYTDGCDTLTPVADDDDGCDAPTTFGSILTDIEVVGGQDYLIEWDDRWGADAFDWELTFTTQSPNLEICDEAPFDGFTLFDLETQTVIILNGQDPVDFDVTYHETQSDADNNVNSLESPYANTVNPQEIYARVTEITSGEYTTTNFTITVINCSPVIATQPPNLEICDEVPFDGLALFDLETQTVIILNGQNSLDFDVTYHETQLDADNNVNSLFSPYTNTVNPQEIYVRVTETTSGEYATTNFTITVIDCSPVIATQPPNLEICDEAPFDGLALFDLETQTAIVLGPQNSLDFNVTYHETQLDADNNVNSLFSPYTNTVNPQEIYVRVTETTSGEYATTNFTITVIDCSADFYLNPNGVTCMCPNAAFGETGVVNGITYTKRTKEQITEANAATTCTSGITDMSNLFSQNPNFNGNISSWDTSNVTNMYAMFLEATSFNQPIGNWDVSNVTDMYGTFGRATSFNQPVENWNVVNVFNMDAMFFEASSFNQPIGNWDVSNVINMQRMFSEATSFNQSIGNWDVSNVNNMYGMFLEASSFNQSIGNWDVSNVTTMNAMFEQAIAFNQNLNNWNFNSNIVLDSFVRSSGLDVSNYEDLLFAFVNQNIVDKFLDAFGLAYCNISAREDLIINKGWTISGDSFSQPNITAPNNLNIDPDPSSCVAENVALGTPTTTGGCGVLTISNDAPNNYPIGVTQVIWTLIDENGIESTDTQTVTVTLTVDVAEVCYVSSDQLQVTNNRIFITNDPNSNGLNVEYHEVLRESPSGDYEAIGFITPPEVSFLDTESNNTSQAYRYKIRTTDICGVNYPESSFHKTILLQSGIASDNSINLSWTPYLGLDFSTYNIYKNTNGTGYELLTSLSFNNTTYNDTSANVVDNFYEYYVSIEVESCDSAGLLPLNLRSNLELVNPNLSINNFNLLGQEIQIYPNPASDYLNISIPKGVEITAVSIYNAVGQRIFVTMEFENINISNLSAGLYYLSINTNKGLVNKTMICE